MSTQPSREGQRRGPLPLALMASLASLSSLARRVAFPSLMLNVILLGVSPSRRTLGWTDSSLFRIKDEQILVTKGHSPGGSTVNHFHSNTSDCGYVRYNKIIGHVHMAKTAGTEINGELAAHFERVCGHKGYSYDAYQYNRRVKNGTFHDINRAGTPDEVSRLHPGFNRGRVLQTIMMEIGFEDCDYISGEWSWHHWQRHVLSSFNTSGPSYWPLELHVPCRNPLDHLLSQCNYRKRRFNCRAYSLVEEIDKCMVETEIRFNLALTKLPNVSLKCFSPIPIDPYLDFMSHILQRKRIETDYVPRSTNLPRQKGQECLLQPANAHIARRVLKILDTYDYYSWCSQCMGGPDDLLAISSFS